MNLKLKNVDKTLITRHPRNSKLSIQLGNIPNHSNGNSWIDKNSGKERTRISTRKK
jgi:hypothetical protein